MEIDPEWWDTIDDITDTTQVKPPYDRHYSSDTLQVGLIIPYHKDTISLGDVDVRHELKDTKYHRVNYKITGTSRFQEHFPEGPFTRTSDNWVDVLNSGEATAPQGKVLLAGIQVED